MNKCSLHSICYRILDTRWSMKKIGIESCIIHRYKGNQNITHKFVFWGSCIENDVLDHVYIMRIAYHIMGQKFKWLQCCSNKDFFPHNLHTSLEKEDFFKIVLNKYVFWFTMRLWKMLKKIYMVFQLHQIIINVFVFQYEKRFLVCI